MVNIVIKLRIRTNKYRIKTDEKTFMDTGQIYRVLRRALPTMVNRVTAAKKLIIVTETYFVLISP